jgi:7-cyano-7-deazaguanine synthase
MALFRNNNLMIPKTIIHLLSGGLDSVTMLYDLVGQGHNVHCLLFDYHQRHVQELLFAKAHCRRLNVLFTTINLPELGGLTEKDWVVPNRNAIFLSIAVNIAMEAKADTITIGCNQDDVETFPDCRPQFLKAINVAVKEAGYEIEICAPYSDKKKWWIGGLAREMKVNLSEIWSCYKGGANPCGKCPACKKLEQAIKE